jgi:hypothetical protein
MKLIFTLILLVSSTFAFENQMSLKGALSYTSSKIKAQAGTEDDTRGFGFNTHLGYRWKYFELDLSSYIYWGNIEGLTFQANGETINGSGTFRHVSFGPIFKYHFQSPRLFTNWTFYTGVGPVWSLQTVKMKNFTSSGPKFIDTQKLTFDSFGGMLVIGIEEQLEHKEAHPAFLEIVYSYKNSYKLSVVDASDPVETNILSSQEADQELSGHYFMVSFGITIF